MREAACPQSSSIVSQPCGYPSRPGAAVRMARVFVFSFPFRRSLLPLFRFRCLCVPLWRCSRLRVAVGVGAVWCLRFVCVPLCRRSPLGVAVGVGAAWCFAFFVCFRFRLFLFVSFLSK